MSKGPPLTPGCAPLRAARGLGPADTPPPPQPVPRFPSHAHSPDPERPAPGTQPPEDLGGSPSASTLYRANQAVGVCVGVRGCVCMSGLQGKPRGGSFQGAQTAPVGRLGAHGWWSPARTWAPLQGWGELASPREGALGRFWGPHSCRRAERSQSPESERSLSGPWSGEGTRQWAHRRRVLRPTCLRLRLPPAGPPLPGHCSQLPTSLAASLSRGTGHFRSGRGLWCLKLNKTCRDGDAYSQ